MRVRVRVTVRIRVRVRVREHAQSTGGDLLHLMMGRSRKS